MQVDAELINDFISETQALEKELQPIVASLKQNPAQKALFEKFGQIIDRIYGTAATFGFKEFADYCGMLKKTSYDCSKCENPRAQQKVLSLLENCMQNLGALQKSINEPEVLKKLHHTLHLEIQKSNRIYEEIFQFLKK